MDKKKVQHKHHGTFHLCQLWNCAVLFTFQVIYMARNPKDLVVSYYQFHRSLRTMSYRGTFQEFCRRFMNDKRESASTRLPHQRQRPSTVDPSALFLPFLQVGYGSWFEHVQEFWEHRMNSNVLFLKYEDMYKVRTQQCSDLCKDLPASGYVNAVFFSAVAPFFCRGCVTAWNTAVGGCFF